MSLEELIESLGNLRYNMSTNAKEAIAARGTLPGSPKDSTPDKALANRYASGYLFAQNYPNAAPRIQPVADYLHYILGDDMLVQSQATMGMDRALLERQRAAAQEQAWSQYAMGVPPSQTGE